MRGIRRRSRHPFLGRADELKHCEDLLCGEVDAIYVYGEHGLGKSRLLSECAKLAEARHMPVARLDAQRVGHSPGDVADALAQLPKAGVEPSLLLIDNFEAHACLELFYRDTLLPSLGQDQRLMFAGTTPLAFPWGARNRRRLLHIPLKRLSDLDAEAYLEAIGVSAPERHHVATRSRGKPLILATMAEFASSGRRDESQLNGEPYSLTDLLHQVLAEAPTDEHRQALWTSAMCLVLSERTLAAILDLPRSNECYRWLSSRPYIERVQGGLTLHPLLRDPLLKDLRDTSPELHREFLLRSGRFHISRLEGLRDPQRRRTTVYSHFYAQRLQPPIASLYQQLRDPQLFRDRFQPSDREALQQMVLQHEGARAAALCEHWLDTQSERTSVFRSIEGNPRALLLPLLLSETTLEDERRDPALAAAFSVLQARAQLKQAKPPARTTRRHRRLGRNVSLVRFWLDGRTYQSSSSAQAELVAHMVLSALAAADLTALFVVVPDRHQPQIARLIDNGLLQGFSRSHFDLDGQAYHLVGVDFAELSYGAWLRNTLSKTISGGRARLDRPFEAWRMSRVDFAQAVQSALQHFSEPQLLSQSPLARTIPMQGPADYGLRQWILDGLNRLARMPGGAIYAKQLQMHYVHGGASDLPDNERDMDQLLAAQQLLIATLWDALMQQQRVRQQAV